MISVTVRRRAVLLAASLAALGAASVAQAQSAARPCRITFDDQSWGPVDPWTTHGDITLGPLMRQSDGSFVIMGRGTLTVTFETNLRDGCTIVSGAEKTHQAQAVVSGRDKNRRGRRHPDG